MERIDGKECRINVANAQTNDTGLWVFKIGTMENEIYKERDTYLEIYSLPDFVTSILQPSPLIKRQVIQSTIFNILHNKDYYVSGREYLHFYLFTDCSMYVLYITVDVNILVFKFRGR